MERPGPVLIICHDVVGPHMAGPGIRYTALAQELSREFPVVLAAPEGSIAKSLPLFYYQKNEWAALLPLIDNARVVIATGDILARFPNLCTIKKPLVIDGYIPHPVETLALNRNRPAEQRQEAEKASANLLAQQCLSGDFFLCASETQRIWWLGVLQAYGRINALTFEDDPSLRHLIDVVPFALPETPFPEQNPQALPGIRSTDKVLLWGGGLWDWLDPVTAIYAMPRILEVYPNTKLLFPGIRHPNPRVPVMRKIAEVTHVAQALGLLNTHVLLGNWVSRLEWPAYLARADVGLSLHPDTIESRLAFRSRLFDYIWAGLPMVVTQGDETSQIVKNYNLGYVVEFYNVEQVARAILQLLETPKTALRVNFKQAQQELTWANAVEPLIAFCRSPRKAPDRISPHQSQYCLTDEDNYLTKEDMKKIVAERQQLIQERNFWRDLAHGYEQGRFMRFLRWIHRLVSPYFG